MKVSINPRLQIKINFQINWSDVYVSFYRNKWVVYTRNFNDNKINFNPILILDDDGNECWVNQEIEKDSLKAAEYYTIQALKLGTEDFRDLEFYY